TLVALSPMGGRGQVRGVGLQDDVPQVDLVQKSVDLPVLEGGHAPDAQFHIEGQGPPCLGQGTGEAVEYPEELLPPFPFQDLEYLIKGLAAVDHDGQPVPLGHVDLPQKGILLLGQAGAVPIQVDPNLPHPMEPAFGQPLLHQGQFLQIILLHMGGVQAHHQKDMLRIGRLQVQHGLGMGGIDGRDEKAPYPGIQGPLHHGVTVLVKGLAVQMRMGIGDDHSAKIDLSWGNKNIPPKKAWPHSKSSSKPKDTSRSPWPLPGPTTLSSLPRSTASAGSSSWTPGPPTAVWGWTRPNFSSSPPRKVRSRPPGPGPWA